MCERKYIGKFCKSGTGGTVLGFVCIKNGIPEFTYYDPLTGMPYFGAVDESCGSSFSVYSETWNNKSGLTITDARFANIKIDTVTNKHLIIIVKDGIVAQEGASISGFTISGTTITLTDAMSPGEVISIQFVY